MDSSVQSVETREGAQTFTLTQNHRKGTRNQVSRAAETKSSESIQTLSTAAVMEGIRPKRGRLEKPGGPKVRSGVRSDLKEAGVEDLQLIPRLY